MEAHLVKEREAVLQPGIKEEEVQDKTSLCKIKKTSRCKFKGGREGDARGKRYGNICICVTDSFCYKAETNTPL